MRRMRFAVLASISAVLVFAGSARAHHSFAAAFDITQPVTVKGTIAEVRLENPHSWFFVDVKDANGKVERWAFEGSTPTSLLRGGLKPGFVKTGDEVTIKGFRARDLTQTAGAARELVLADGRAFAVGPIVGPGSR
jgi:hypothetical protein